MSDKITPSGGPDSPNFRLPRNVVPSRYELRLTPDLKEFRFSGQETIEVTVREPVTAIVLNSKELEIQEACVENGSGTNLKGTVSLVEKTELATIAFAGTLGKGDWKLQLKFAGTLNDKLKGFYRSFWTDAKGGKHAIATTQFESTDARRAFPCFDEPEFKATYKVTLVVDEHLTAISNGRKLREEVIDDGIRYIQDPGPDHRRKKEVEFAETMKMSTYLLAFIVGEFVSSKPIHVNGKEVRVWCVPGKEQLTGFALRSAAFAIDWYERYFEIAYPGGDKIDLIAIPDFAAGAMENLGCITFRETALLVDEATASHGELERVAVVVKHELAHMWFGDLVTMKWWNGLWLNESFATFMENKSLAAWRPEWKIWDGFGSSRAAASRVDALGSTHPIESPVNHPDDAQELFDVISYEKGCSTLYQIEQFIGEEVFRRGIVSYLKKHSYGNTETHDLWDSLEEACRDAGLSIPVRRIMDAWVFTAGHPVVSVTEADAPGFVELSQQPFKFLSEAVDGNTLWPVPLTVRAKTASGVTTRKLLLDSKAQTVYLGERLEWVVVNAGGSGFYRVRYSPRLLQQLTADVQNTLSVIERFNLVNDTWSCVRAGLTSTPDYLEMVKLFAGETDPTVWGILLGSVARMHSILPATHRPVFEKLVHGLVKPTADRLGWAPAAGESVQTRQLRGSLLGTLGRLGQDAAVRDKARELFAAWEKDKTSVDSNVLPAVVSILAYVGNQEQYDKFWRLFKEAKTPQESDRFLMALAGFRDLGLLERAIASCLSADVRTQDAWRLFVSLISNEVAGRAAWNFLTENWEKIVAAYPENGMVRLVSGISELDTLDKEAEVKKFFAEHKVKSGDMAVAQALEQLRINVALRERESKKLADHLVPPAPPAPPAPVDQADGSAS